MTNQILSKYGSNMMGVLKNVQLILNGFITIILSYFYDKIILMLGLHVIKLEIISVLDQ